MGVLRAQMAHMLATSSYTKSFWQRCIFEETVGEGALWATGTGDNWDRMGTIG